MKNERKTKAQLIRELEAAHQQAAELKQSQEHLAIIFHNVSDLIFLIAVEPGPRFRYLAVNPALLKAVGLTEQELVSRIVEDVFPPEEAAAIVENYTRALLARKPITYEEQRNLPAGQQMFETTLTPIVNEYGECTHLLGTSDNITERKKAEHALRESEERYRIISESISDYAFLYCPENDNTVRIEWVTESFTKVTGYTIEELRNQKNPWALYIYPEDLRRISRIVRAVEPGQSTAYEFRITTKGGETRWIQSHVKVVGDAHGNIVHVYGVARDITERKQAEVHLTESQRHLQALFDNTVDAIFLADDKARLIDVNPAACAMFGYSREEFLQRGVWDIAPVQDRAAQYQLWQTFLADGSQSGEYTMTRKDGTSIDVEFRAVANIAPGLHLAVHRDVTERKRAEKALRESQELFSRFMDNSPTAAYMKDEEGRYVYASKAFERVFAMPPGYWLGKTDCDLWPEMAQQLQEHDTMVLAGDKTVELLETTQWGGNLQQWLSFKFPLTVSSGQRILAGISLDITDRKRAEEERLHLQHQLLQAQKLEAVGTLAGGLAHDLNNMLSAVVGFTELALDEVPPESVTHRNLEEVLKSSFRAKALIQQLLTFSCSGPQDREPLAMLPIIEETLRFVRVSLPPSMAVSSSCMAPETKIWGNPSQLQQMVMNLCMNAAHAMEEHGGTLTVSLHRVEVDEALCLAVPQLQPGVHARLSIQDTGTGMTPAVVERIFEPFLTTKPIGKGSGLGLAIVHGIVTSHNGAIAVESQPGKGTTFYVYFPLIADGTLSEQSPSSSADSGKGAHPYDAHSSH